ncbi:MAG: Hsp70 family protein [Deltaproteobacteria bacterium]|nr:Hsp70 family protein [Deltaproteobacteria bacterium]
MVYAIDLGTTNTGVATWDAASRRPRFIHLPDVCRSPSSDDPLLAPTVVPSAVHLVEPTGLGGKLGRWGIFRKRLWGTHGLIGRPALDKNQGHPSPEFAPTFKAALMRSPMKVLARLGNEHHTARDVGRVFLRELTRAVKQATGERWRSLVFTTPVDAYETFRAELVQIARELGIDKVRFLDEPVAAALGYGVGLGAARRILVVDMGAGTAHVALVEIDIKGTEAGVCKVIAKAGRQLGGNLVDRWLVDAFCKKLDYPLTDADRDEERRFWYLVLLDEARRVKESVFFRDKDAFYLTPPEELRAWEARVRGTSERLLEVSKGDIAQILDSHGYYRDMAAMLDDVLADARVDEGAIDDVLLTGGSTLLPGIYTLFEERFGRDRVRAWQPFEAVAFGAAAYAAGAISQSDCVVHDYAFLTYDARSNDPVHTVVIPRGTRVPTVPDLWRRQLVPTCALGEPERFFKLVMCEIGRSEPEERRFAWDEAGQLKRLGGKDDGLRTEAVVVELNSKNPTLGELDPPHQPGDRTPRLEIAFGVNVERWLVATVRDLKTGKQLMDQKPVVRIL